MLADTHTRPVAYPPPDLDLVHSDLTVDPTVEPALARLILDQVAAGSRPATLRISRLGRTVAFGRRDRIVEGYPEAVRAAREAGFRTMERLTGGRVAAHSEGTMVLALTTPEHDPAAGTSLRFRRGAELVRDALTELGIDARIGPVPGEYCPGEWSVNGAGRIKLAGAGQRIVRGAVHLAFVIVASEGERIRAVLDPVHAALGLDWNPATAGAADDLRPGTTSTDVECALIEGFRRESRIRPVELDSPTLEQARSAAGRQRKPAVGYHRAPAPGAGRRG